MSTFPAITDEMAKAGRLWTPELSLNFLERDWGGLDRANDFSLDEFEYSTIGTDTFELHWVFPDSWALDPSFDQDGQLRLRVWLEARKTGLGAVANFEFQENSVVPSGDVTDSNWQWYMLERYWTDPLPTGLVTVTVEIVLAMVTIRRLWGSGADSGPYFNFRG